MNPKQLIMRCFAEQYGDLWVAVCLDFTLAAQGESFEEVKLKLEVMIADYVRDALVGDDKDHARYFLTRRAPLNFWLKYYWIKLKVLLCHQTNTLFDEIMPLKPA